jgi:hypothetical protein
MLRSMSEECLTHGVIGGVTKCPLYVEEDVQCHLLLIQRLLDPNHELMKSRFHRLSSLVCMLIGMK